MRSRLLVPALAALLALLCGCGPLFPPSESGGEVPLPTDNPELADRLVEDQTFDVTLEQWGRVTFASYRPEEPGEGDVEFRLLLDGQAIYTFPGYNEENTSEGGVFSQVRAVAFRDFDGDGRTDIIIIVRYLPEGETDPEQGYDRVRLYTREDLSAEFSMPQYDPPLEAYLQEGGYTDCIASVLEGIAAYQAEQAPPVESGDPVPQAPPQPLGQL